MTLILASGSPRRRTLLRLLVDDFSVLSPDVDETFPPGPAPQAMETVALRKAEAIPRTDRDVVLAADTAVLLGDQVLAKPVDVGDARRMLESLNGRDQHVVTAVAVTGPSGDSTFHVTTTVRFHLPPDVLDAYLDAGAWQGKAGGYGIQDALLAPHATVEGPWSNVVGLPLEAVRAALMDQGVHCHPAPDEARLTRQNPF